MDSAARAFFYPSLFYNVTLEKLRIRDWYNQIEERIVLGALPFKSTLEEVVKNLNVTHFLTLNEDHELQSFYPKPEDFSRHNCTVKRVKVCDFVGAPPIEDIEEAVDFIDSVLKKDDKSVVYVHCKAGRSRSSMMLAAYFIRERGMTAQEAYDYMKSKRKHVDFHGLHWDTLKSYTEYLKSKQN